MSLLASTFRWLQRKRYQYEVTFSLYMLTPTEKFIFSAFSLILFLSPQTCTFSLPIPRSAQSSHLGRAPLFSSFNLPHLG